ncbi:MAG: hypothetical protein RIS83_829 [Pseudomonadota bacterium]
MMFARRSLLTLPLMAVAATARAEPAAARFRVMREGREIGTHQVSLRGTPARQSVRTELDLQVKLLGFTVFRLRHEIEEDWERDQLLRLVSRHERNGSLTTTQIAVEAGGLVAHGPEGTQRLPRNAAPLTWWNPAIFARPLFRPVNGQLFTGQIARSAANGGSQYRLTSEITTIAGYDAAARWIAFTTQGEDGSAVTYEPLG